MPAAQAQSFAWWVMTRRPRSGAGRCGTQGLQGGGDRRGATTERRSQFVEQGGDALSVQEEALGQLAEGLVEPVQGLSVAPPLDTAWAEVVPVVEHRLPGLVEARVRLGGRGEHRWHPRVTVGAEDAQGTAVLGSSLCGEGPLVAIGLIDHEDVGELDDAAFDALEFVAGTTDQQQQERVDQFGNRDFGLTDADGLDEHDVVAGCFAELHDLASAARHSTQRRASGGGADERGFMVGEAVHAGLVAEDTAAGPLAGWVDGEDRDSVFA